MRKLFLVVTAFILVSFISPSLKKRISDASYRYEFYTTDKLIDPKENREYFWFKGGAIHNTEYGIGGQLLHDEFLKYYHSNQLAEAGKFKNGLKDGTWKIWYENGVLQSKTYWKRGQKNGKYFAFDRSGSLAEEGKYRHNLKNGRWINYTRKDTLKYKDGKLVVKKDRKDKDSLNIQTKDSLQLKKKKGILRRLFSKKGSKAKDSLKQAEINIPSPETEKPLDTVKIKKQGFFNRIFSKKEAKNG